jgi:hypothetical protein
MVIKALIVNHTARDLVIFAMRTVESCMDFFTEM